MKQEIIANFQQHANTTPAATPGMQVVEQAELSWVDSGLKSDTFNVAFAHRGRSLPLSQIQVLQSYYQKQQAAFCLWVPEDELWPQLEPDLRQAGLRRQAMAVGMGMLSAEVPAIEIDTTGIEAVQTTEDLAAYASVIAANWLPPDEDVQQYYQRASEAYLSANSPSRLFIYRQEGEVIATGELFAVDQQTAGIYGLCTLETHRRKGIATRMMSYIMQQACQSGYEQLILHASEAGLGIYHRLGFRTHTHLYEYA